MIEDGTHLLRCLRYVDLNMVRAGKVSHPRDWPWCGYDELTGRRQRYQILDVEHLAQHLDLPNTDALFRLHDQGIQEQILRRELGRQAHWTEALAVGSEEFVKAVESLHRQRRQFTRYAVETGTDENIWAVREASPAYGADSIAKATL
jgi:putative transposase